MKPPARRRQQPSEVSNEVLYSMVQNEEQTRREIFAQLETINGNLNGHISKSGERMSTLEAQLKAVIGNGQPGRLGIAEDKIGELSEWKDKSKGWYAGAGAVFAAIGAIGHWLVDSLRHK